MPTKVIYFALCFCWRKFLLKLYQLKKMQSLDFLFVSAGLAYFMLTCAMSGWKLGRLWHRPRNNE